PAPADPDRAGARPDPRWRADRDPVLAVGVPDQRAVRCRDGRLRLALPPRAPRGPGGPPGPRRADPLGRRPERAPLRDQRGVGRRLGLAGGDRGWGRRDRPALALRPPVAASEGSDPAPAPAARP